MANYMRYGTTIAIIVGILCGQVFSVLEDVDRNGLVSNLSYDKRLDSVLQLARLLTPHFCHSKRNSELINSLLGLPKNMHNAGKRK